MLRVLTLNLQHGRPARGSGLDAAEVAASASAARAVLGRLAGEIAALDADLVLLQEVDCGLRRSARVDQAAYLADALGTPWWRFAAAFGGHGFAGVNPRLALHLRPRRSAVPGGAGYGVAILSRVPVTSWHVAHLPGAGPAVRPRPGRCPFPQVRIESPRVGLAAVVATPRGPLSVAVTHLATHPPLARRQVRSLAGALHRLPGPWLLGGDLNVTPGQAHAALAGERPHRGVAPVAPVVLAEALTFPRGRPDRQIDHLLGFGGLTAAHPGTAHRLLVSDHRALLAHVALPGRAPLAHPADLP